MKLRVFESIPEGFLEAEPQELFQLLSGPSLIHLGKAMAQPALFVSTLLHGNEHSSVIALQRILKQVGSGELELKRPLIVLVGNPEAATQNKRHLESQLDFNRVWSGGTCAQAQAAKEVLDYVKNLQLFCCVDIHNNTGRNPYYSCVNRTEAEDLSLAAHFFEKTVYFTEPHEVLSIAFSKLCPSTTLEVGQSGEEPGVTLLTEKLLELLRKPDLKHSFDLASAELFRTVGRMKIASETTLDFSYLQTNTINFSFLPDVDLFNFKNLEENTSLAKALSMQGFWVEGLQGDDITSEFFKIEDGELKTARPIVPAMITQDQGIAKSDCFGYLMERFKPYS